MQSTKGNDIRNDMKKKDLHPSNEITKPEGHIDNQREPMSQWLDFKLISSYSRAQAIADGVLVDVTRLAHQAGFRYPVAITSAAWHDCVKVAISDHVHDETGRLWDVLNVLRFAIKENRDSSEICFCVDVADENEKVTLIKLKCLCGPGDDAEPVLTIMLPEED